LQPAEIETKRGIISSENVQNARLPLHAGSWHNFHSLGDRKIPATAARFFTSREPISSPFQDDARAKYNAVFRRREITSTPRIVRPGIAAQAARRFNPFPAIAVGFLSVSLSSSSVCASKETQSLRPICFAQAMSVP